MRTLIKFERGWRKIGRKGKCRKDSESTFLCVIRSPYFIHCPDPDKHLFLPPYGSNALIRCIASMDVIGSSPVTNITSVMLLSRINEVMSPL